ncbi:hypothetical protein JZ751_025922 [Albula glossodonta]|uniref:glycerol-3-phosphate 1-O-acyltransferase n=1 Tax=Albula glossodonta TaxID=121402 RepID=A0A8T2ND27_9TELE|nr:hypothetical protein JZ751_025922 [Albula glossodonta]
MLLAEVACYFQTNHRLPLEAACFLASRECGVSRSEVHSRNGVTCELQPELKGWAGGTEVGLPSLSGIPTVTVPAAVYCERGSVFLPVPLISANKSSAVMSTHIVACLLLYRHRQGVVLSKLVEDFFNMKEEILSRDFDLGFSGNSEDVVMHALHLLGNCVNVTSANRNTEFIIAPNSTVNALFELNFYSNGLFHVFITDAIIACSVLAVLREQSRETEQGSLRTLVSQERLIRKAAGLSHFLSNEVAVALEDQEELSPSPTEEPWPKKFQEPLSWRSDEEDEDSDFGEEQRDRYLKRLLSPVLEAYSGAAIFVHGLHRPVAESEYTQQLFRYLLTRTEKKVAAFGESATHYLVKNTVRTFKELGVRKAYRLCLCGRVLVFIYVCVSVWEEPAITTPSRPRRS